MFKVGDRVRIDTRKLNKWFKKHNHYCGLKRETLLNKIGTIKEKCDYVTIEVRKVWLDGERCSFELPKEILTKVE